MSQDRSCLAWLKILILLNCRVDSEHARYISGKGNWGLGGIIGGNFTSRRQPCSFIVPCLACVFYIGGQMEHEQVLNKDRTKLMTTWVFEN